jgi:hypothetical protein
MNSNIFTILLFALFVWVQAATAGQSDAAPQNTQEIAGASQVSTGAEKVTASGLNPATVDPPVSKAYLRMKNDSAKMIAAMQKNITLVEKRIEVAKKKYSFVCVECMEKELPWMTRQLESATLWSEILAEPGASPLDHLEAYWAIQDTHKNVRTMKEKTDKYWRWKLDIE